MIATLPPIITIPFGDFQTPTPFFFARRYSRGENEASILHYRVDHDSKRDTSTLRICYSPCVVSRSFASRRHDYILSCVEKAWHEHGPQATEGVEASATEERQRLDGNAHTPKQSPTAVSRLSLLVGTVIAVSAMQTGRR